MADDTPSRPELPPIRRLRPLPIDDTPDRPVWWVRGVLLAMAFFFGTVIFIATRVQPYAPDGTPLRMASHQSLGLPPCNFKEAVGVPCPSCGMTTSFGLLVRGDVWNSMKANWVGTLLACFITLAIPWCVWCGLRGRYLWVTRFEIFVPVALGCYVVLMLARWIVVIVIDKM